MASDENQKIEFNWETLVLGVEDSCMVFCGYDKTNIYEYIKCKNRQIKKALNSTGTKTFCMRPFVATPRTGTERFLSMSSNGWWQEGKICAQIPNTKFTITNTECTIPNHKRESKQRPATIQLSFEIMTTILYYSTMSKRQIESMVKAADLDGNGWVDILSRYLE